ncbi:hypothetical protein G1C95_1634 [Bifidobacterium sp. DSM 109957]|uniref:Uncharacterized protein n=1 Tax=Bifidobacterium oedipodis TaxID=2675322 RepID=A0A7Y0EQC6_9BIFI|nr:hypothetical protein [Bifidobacterium sp. DSM 109957]
MMAGKFRSARHDEDVRNGSYPAIIQSGSPPVKAGTHR